MSCVFIVFAVIWVAVVKLLDELVAIVSLGSHSDSKIRDKVSPVYSAQGVTTEDE